MQSELKQRIDSRFDREGDWEARQVFSDADLRMSPEEYAARRGHLILSYSLHLYRYLDPNLGNWVKRLGELLVDREELEQVRQRLLSPEELADVRRQEAEEP